MQHHLERIDIENSEYQAWAIDGRPLTLSVQAPVWVSVTPSDFEDDGTGLRVALMNFAERSGTRISDDLQRNPKEIYDQIMASRRAERRR
jgi:hypothetical protein